jgi:LytS/YehU family sensor histidine kinase
LQLQPHFLFNALHTVSGLVRAGEPQAAISTLAGLSELLRYALDSTSAPEVSLGEELDAVRQYLAIQELRFGQRLSVRLDVAAETLPARLPRLLLQPLVENAVRHGAGASGGAAWLELMAARRDGKLAIAIRNSARGGESAREVAGQGRGIGLPNTRARLDQIYGRGYALHTRHLGDRFELTLELPWLAAAEVPAG